MIRIENVSRTYGLHKAVNEFTLTIKEGELCVLIGPSGCGKSTLLKMINRMVEPSSGTVFINGENISSLKPELLRRGIGYVIQNIGLFPHWKVRDNIAVVPRLQKWDEQRIQKRVSFLAELTGLQASHLERYPRELSGGEAQRVGVARALAADPPILLMDEPFGALDPLTRERLQKEFKGIQEQLNKTVVFVTHDVDEAIRLADRIAVMRGGELVATDTPAGFLKKDIPPFAEAFLGKEYGLRLLARYPVKQVMKSATDEMAIDGEPVESGLTLKEALSLMLSGNKKRLRVVTDGKTVGHLDLDDVLKLYREEAHEEIR